MKLFLLSAVLSMSFSLFATEFKKGQCVSEDGSWFVFSDGSIEIYDSLFDETYQQNLELLRENPLQYKVTLEGFSYYLYHDVKKARLYHVFETSSATTRRFYCPLSNPLEGFLQAARGVWHSDDGSVLEIKDDGMAYINDLAGGRTLLAAVSLQKKSGQKIKVRFDRYYLSYGFQKPDEIWVYTDGLNRPFYKVN